MSAETVGRSARAHAWSFASRVSAEGCEGAYDEEQEVVCTGHAHGHGTRTEGRTVWGVETWGWICDRLRDSHSAPQRDTLMLLVLILSLSSVLSLFHALFSRARSFTTSGIWVYLTVAYFFDN